MPQMYPLMWLNLYMFFLLIFFSFIIKNYFFLKTMFFKNNKNLKINLKNINLKW